MGAARRFSLCVGCRAFRSCQNQNTYSDSSLESQALANVHLLGQLKRISTFGLHRGIQPTRQQTSERKIGNSSAKASIDAATR